MPVNTLFVKPIEVNGVDLHNNNTEAMGLEYIIQSFNGLKGEFRVANCVE